MEHLEAARPEKKVDHFFSSFGKCHTIITSLKPCDWSGHIFGASASPRSLQKNGYVRIEYVTLFHYCCCSRRSAFFIFLFFSPSHLLSLPFCSISLLVVPQIWGHIAGSSPPSTPRFVPFVFIVRRVKLFLSPSTRVEFVPTHARHSQ